MKLCGEDRRGSTCTPRRALGLGRTSPIGRCWWLVMYSPWSCSHTSVARATACGHSIWGCWLRRPPSSPVSSLFSSLFFVQQVSELACDDCHNRLCVAEMSEFVMHSFSLRRSLCFSLPCACVSLCLVFFHTFFFILLFPQRFSHLVEVWCVAAL